MNEWVIKWKSLYDNEATWELIHLMNQQFPSFQGHLWRGEGAL